jgi:glycosyltransferase involved in cell wall biosynthesis
MRNSKINRLFHPIPITDQVWPEGTVPVVSVFCITYNHVNFIRDAIEGFLMQETTFPVEIFIHDDASTDGTAKIVKEYAEKYPKLFWTVLQTENQWSKGNPNAYFFGLMQKQRGEFIALCEGDDSWISMEKLQKQVEVLEANTEASLVFHNAWVKHQESHRDRFFNAGIKKNEFSLADVVELGWIAATASVLFRSSIDFILNLEKVSMGGDIVIIMSAALHGKLVYIDKVWSVYNIHEGGQSEKFNTSRELVIRINHPTNVAHNYFLSQKFNDKLAIKKCWERIDYFLLQISEYTILNNVCFIKNRNNNIKKIINKLLEIELPSMNYKFLNEVPEIQFALEKNLIISLENYHRQKINYEYSNKNYLHVFKIIYNLYGSGLLESRELISFGVKSLLKAFCNRNLF